jgi:hypothetical protein
LNKGRGISIILALAAAVVSARPAGAQSDSYGPPPKAGPVEILPLDEVTPGMQAVAWTTFRGATPEAVPVEILGRMHNSWGPNQDIILAKLGGQAQRTNVAGGMSGSPVYYEGKLIGAIALRFSVFSPDAIAGITPIELMLEINELDRSRPLEVARAEPPALGEDFASAVWASRGASLPAQREGAAPIETPVMISGLHDGVLDTFAGYFLRQGFRVMQAGAGASGRLTRGDSADALQPGETIAAVLMAGDMSANAVGTVSYNDGRTVLGFGHAMFNSGPISAPIATGDVLHVLASQLAPVKIANAKSIVGALRQDRHSGILGVLGETAPMTPVEVTVRQFGEGDQVVSSKSLHYEVFQNEKWTPQLLMLALYNSMFGVNEFSEEATFRLNAKLEFAGDHEVAVRTMQTTMSSNPQPTPLVVAGSVANRLQKVFTNARDTPSMERVEAVIDLLPERRTATIEQVWLERRRARPGDTLVGKVILQPYRGSAFEREFRLQVPAGAPKGRLTLMVSEAALWNQKRDRAAQRSRTLSLPETVSLLNQELSNDQVYIALLDQSPTAYLNGTALPNVPMTALNVMRPASQGRLALEAQSPVAETSLALDAVVSGAQSITLTLE